MNQAASVMGGTTAMLGGLMAQATPDASISNTGIVIGAGGLIVAVANGLFPYWKSWLDSKKLAEDVEELKQANEEAARKILEAKAEADRKIAALEQSHKDDMAAIVKKRHDERDRVSAMYYKQQAELAEARIMVARLEGRLGSAINVNADQIEKVANHLDPPVTVERPHIDLPPPGLPGAEDSSDDIPALGSDVP